MTFIQDASIELPKLKQQNLPSGRVYLVESGPHSGTIYPSITRILKAKPKPALDAWKKRVGVEEAQRVANRSANRGTTLHTQMERYLSNKPLLEMTPTISELWGFVQPWFDEHITKVYALEADVYSHVLGVAGRFDVLAEVDGHLAVVDLKNALREKKLEYLTDYFIQTTFYACAVYEITGRKVKHAYLPIVSPEGLQLVEVHPMEHLNEMVAAIKDFYKQGA